MAWKEESCGQRADKSLIPRDRVDHQAGVQ